MTPLVPRELLPLEPRISVFGGGSGGVGRSTIVREIGAHLARRGRRTLLVDASMQQPSLYLLIQKAPPTLRSGEVHDFQDIDLGSYVIAGIRDEPSLLSLRHLRPGAAFPLNFKASQLIERLRKLDFDEVLVDLDSRNDAFNASMLALSDVPIFVSSVEAASLSATVEALRQMLVFAMLLQPEAPAAEHRLMQALESLPADFTIGDVHDVFTHPDVRPILLQVLEHAQPWLLLNQTSDATERELAQAIALGVSAMIGVRPRVLGTIGFDPQRKAHLRQNRPSEELRTDGENLSIVAQRLLALSKTSTEQTRISPALIRHPTDLIGVQETLPPREIRLAWRHLWDGLRRESAFTRHVLPSREREMLLLQLEEASQRLQAWLSTREKVEATAASPRINTSPIGQKLQKARANAGISIRDLSLRSRIGLRYLEAIENFEVEALPREVYLRGYLREVARALGLDPEALVEDYLAELLETRARLLKESSSSSQSE